MSYCCVEERAGFSVRSNLAWIYSRFETIADQFYIWSSREGRRESGLGRTHSEIRSFLTRFSREDNSGNEDREMTLIIGQVLT